MFKSIAKIILKDELRLLENERDFYKRQYEVMSNYNEQWRHSVLEAAQLGIINSEQCSAIRNIKLDKLNKYIDNELSKDSE